MAIFGNFKGTMQLNRLEKNDTEVKSSLVVKTPQTWEWRLIH